MASEYIQYSGGIGMSPFTGQKTTQVNREYGEGNFYTETVNTPEYEQWIQQYNKMNAIPSGGKASDILASVTRAQWEDVKQNFLPIEQDILQQLTFNNPSLLPDSINAAQKTAGRMTDVTSGVRDRSIARYGITMDAQSREAMQSSDTLNKTKNMVNAGNYTRQRLLDRDKELMLGGISALNAE